VEKLKAYHLTESQKHGAAIIFGRFNPPHFGHSNAWTVASHFPIWYVGTNQSTQGPKDPLPYEVKVEVMKTIMPEIEGHLVAEQSWWTLATMVYKQHGGDMVLHVVTDPTDKEIFVPQLQKYNGQEGPHGFYQFQDIVWEPATRDSTATALRAAVANDDPQAFSKAAGIDANTMIAGHPFFELVKHYMTPYLQAGADKEKQKAEKERLRAEKEKQKAEKATMKQSKAKGPAQELVESQRMSAQVKLQRAWEREQSKSTASRQRADQAKAEFEKEWKAKQEKEKQSVAEVKQRLDPKCWKGKHKEGTKIKGGVRVNNCVPNESINERSTSEKQARTMAAAAHDPKFAKKLGIKTSVAKEFNQADKGTKQLSNAMKHKRISEALEELYEAKARESLKKFEQDAIPGMTVYDSLNNSDSYASYRFGIALAPSPDFTDMAKKSALANSFAMIDYTDADAKIRKGAEKTMGVRSSSSSSAKSKELEDTNKLSPIANVKRNKYGI